MEKHPIEPLPILNKVVSQFAERYNRTGITMDLSIQTDDALLVEGDGNKLAQLFGNLLENTLSYTDPPGLLRIREKHDAEWLTIWFEDSAPGVPDQALEPFFERLYRVDSSRNRNLGGSGLGLAICKQIAASHGGTIGAREPNSAAWQLKFNFREKTMRQMVDSGILIVEDEQKLADLLADYLTSAGFQRDLSCKGR